MFIEGILYTRFCYGTLVNDLKQQLTGCVRNFYTVTYFTKKSGKVYQKSNVKKFPH